MKKSVKRILIIIPITILGIFTIALVLFQLSFEPIESIKRISLIGNNVLICKQTYNSDLAAEFYDVEFTLKINDGSEFKLGNGSFFNRDWFKDIHLYKLFDLYVLPVKDDNYSKALIINRNSGKNKDTILSPLNLRYDSLWSAEYNEIPSWSYDGTSKIDTLIANRIIVSYEYRLGDYTPFKFYTQKIGYIIDSSGNLTTEKIFDRIERKKGY